MKKTSETNIKVAVKNRKNELLQFCKSVDIHFKNLDLLDQAFNHRSIKNEKKELQNNERLEFLGDSVLGMVTAAYLYKNLENSEGDLAKIKSAVVSEESLAPIANKLGINKLLRMSKGEEMTGGRNKPAILADCMEAIIGAYYVDSGYKAAEKYVLEFIIPEIKNVLENGIGMKDYKTVLQEKYQKLTKTTPKYELLSVSGPDHEQIFEVQVLLGEKAFGPVKGKSKREAQQQAAKLALDYLNSQS